MKSILSKIFKNYIAIIAVIVGLISVCYLVPGIAHGHDLRFHLSRINGIAYGIKLGSWFNPIHYNFLAGYGYGTGLFYSNFFLYIPAILVALGMNLIEAYKIFLVIVTLLTSFIMYFTSCRIIKDKKISLIATCIYILMPYRTTDIVIRAAIGEILSFIFIPIIILGIYEIIYGDDKKWYIFSIGFAGLILSHILSTLIMAIICFFILIINFKRINYKKIQKIVNATILCLLVTAFFVGPLIEQSLIGDAKINEKNIIAGSPELFTIDIEDILSNFQHNKTEYAPFKPAGIGFLLIIITNQSGVARGYFDEVDVQNFNAYLVDLLKEKGVNVTATYYCPHMKGGAVNE